MAWKDRFVKNARAEEKKHEDREVKREEAGEESVRSRYKTKVVEEKAEESENRDFVDPFPDKKETKTSVEPEEQAAEEAENIRIAESTRVAEMHREEQEKALKLADWYLEQTEKEREADRQEEGLTKRIKKKELRIGIVLDCTYSFSTVYPVVYNVLQRFFNRLEQEKDQYKGFQLKYSLTMLHDEPEAFLFAGNSIVTSSEKEVLNALKTLEFYGGSEDGREDLNEALKNQLMTLNAGSDGKNADCYKGLLFFTDSLPEEELTPDFDEDDFEYNGNTYQNYGLRFAEIYSYDGRYKPNLKMVDGNGRPDSENGRNETDYYDIHILLNGDSTQIVENAEKLVNNIIVQASVRNSMG